MRIQGCGVNNRGRQSRGGCWNGGSRASHLLEVEGDGLVGPYASCDHEVGEEAGLGGTHEAGKEANMRGGRQQI